MRSKFRTKNRCLFFLLNFFVKDAWNLINRLREEIIEQIKVQDKLKYDAQQLEQNHKAELREREQIEELLHRDLTEAKDQIGKNKFNNTRVFSFSLNSSITKCSK